MAQKLLRVLLSFPKDDISSSVCLGFEYPKFFLLLFSHSAFTMLAFGVLFHTYSLTLKRKTSASGKEGPTGPGQSPGSVHRNSCRHQLFPGLSIYLSTKRPWGVIQ